MFVTRGLGAVGARHVAEIDARWFFDLEKRFAVDGAVGVEELIRDVSEDRGATGGDATLDDQDQEAGKKLIDVDGGFKLRNLRQEVGGQVEGVAGLGGEKGADSGTGAEVVEAKPKMGIGGVEAATLAVGETVQASAAGFGATLGRLVLRCDW
jgi:hypothetical protein